MNTKRVVSIRWWIVAGLIAFLLAGSPPNLRAQRDRGINQPGAAGNRGGRDPGVNQPGAVGNRGVGGSARQAGVVGDPGLNPPCGAGNRR
mgnify:CR=1 FL=1